MAGFKRRQSADNKPAVDEKQIQAFIDGADKTPEEIARLDPDAKRDFKQLGFKVNQYEYERIMKLQKKLARSEADALRFAALKLADEILEN